MEQFDRGEACLQCWCIPPSNLCGLLRVGKDRERVARVFALTASTEGAQLDEIL